VSAPETTKTLWVSAYHGRNDTQRTEQPYLSMRERADSAIPLLLAHPGVKGPNDAQERHRSGGYHILVCVLVLVTQTTTTGSCVASAPLEMVKHGTRGENEHKPPKDSVERHTKHVKALYRTTSARAVVHTAYAKRYTVSGSRTGAICTPRNRRCADCVNSGLLVDIVRGRWAWKAWARYRERGGAREVGVGTLHEGGWPTGAPGVWRACAALGRPRKMQGRGETFVRGGSDI